MCQEDSGYDLPPCYFLSGTNQLTALPLHSPEAELFYKYCIWLLFYLFSSQET